LIESMIEKSGLLDQSTADWFTIDLVSHPNRIHVCNKSYVLIDSQFTGDCLSIKTSSSQWVSHIIGPWNCCL